MLAVAKLLAPSPLLKGFAWNISPMAPEANGLDWNIGVTPAGYFAMPSLVASSLANELFASSKMAALSEPVRPLP